MNLRAFCPSVTNRWLSIPSIKHIAHNQDMWCATEGISEYSSWVQENLRIVPLCLLSAASIVVPDAKILDVPWSAGHRHGLGARSLVSIKPHHSPWVQENLRI